MIVNFLDLSFPTAKHSSLGIPQKAKQELD